MTDRWVDCSVLRPAPALLSGARDPARHRAPQGGRTGLIMASEKGHLEVVRLLLESRADANLADEVQPPPPPHTHG